MRDSHISIGMAHRIGSTARNDPPRTIDAADRINSMPVLASTVITRVPRSGTEGRSNEIRRA
ncbi:hypothetical protein [Nocardia sp. NPDC056100]|uniref:hypothetical protein n=1 Tax=Nocardia sp. NPDC056100 TaxID=3345712 RepID=UPI0035E31D24